MPEAVNASQPEVLGRQALEDRLLELSTQLVVAYDQDADMDQIARLHRRISKITLAIELPDEPPRFYEPGQYTSGVSLFGALATIASSYIRA